MNTQVLRNTLRQMLSVLETERQALAGLDLDAIVGSSADKNTLCKALDCANDMEIDEECRGLVDAARRQNEVNRQVRNLVSANVAGRLDAITGSARLYEPAGALGYAGRRA